MNERRQFFRAIAGIVPGVAVARVTTPVSATTAIWSNAARDQFRREFQKLLTVSDELLDDIPPCLTSYVDGRLRMWTEDGE